MKQNFMLVGGLCYGLPTLGFVMPTSRCSTAGSRSAFSRMDARGSFLMETDDDTTAPANNGASYIRWKTRSSANAPSADVWELQTAVTTFQRTNPETKTTERIELHAQVHFGAQEYFDYFNSAEFRDKHDQVLYELLVDESLLGLSPDKRGRSLTEGLQASQSDQSLAQGYGWMCQVDVMDYTQPKWKHADFTRQELLQQQQQQQQRQGSALDSNSRPLWQQGTTLNFWQPAVSALFVGPPSLFVAADTDDPAAATKRQLFTNLFLPGNQLAGWLRAMLWVTVPAPEISVLLLDWSSLFLSTRSSAKFSPVTLPILQSLMTLQIAQLRQLIFGQVLVSGNSGQQQQQKQNQDWNLLVTQRNDHALRVLRSSLVAPSTGRKQPQQLALLYGCSHCPDLHTKLVRDFGFAPTKTTWRTAWSVSVPNTFARGDNNGPNVAPAATKQENVDDSSMQLLSDLTNSLPPTAWAALFVLFPLYLGVGAVDWVDTIHSSSVSLLEKHNPVSFTGDWFLYLIRHVLCYIGVSKFSLEWQDPNNRNNNKGT
ncbi:expressed unknown protein [Seminavis robusta]|uniref:Uncharacterized protein n=1 Tax=Seminavis robusta TaxID=568900 RepID=A0A9N8DI09_9STRA|nr:expressed unknown protein [Seminavis robusta]|eukprot:Sro168_g074830.1 n/a (541) ;mRNA; r:49939-51561